MKLMKRNEYKRTLTDLKYFIEESDDIEEIKKHMDFLINMNMNCMETIYELQEELKYIKDFLSEKKIITRKLSQKDITEN